MSRKNISPNNRKKNTDRKANRIPWRYCLLTMICGFFLIVGFFFAARQHFSSIDYSMKNNRLRKQLDELESDKRRLLLAKEIALSPAEIRKVAKKVGFTETVNNIAAIPAGINSAVKPKTEKLAETVKQAVADKVETLKKTVETTSKEAVKSVKASPAKDKSDKPRAQVDAR